jgi:hypothetical protein
MKLVEIEPGRFVVDRERALPPRSSLPMPHVISDEMPPTEQVDGRYYTSKAAFRAVGRANGLTEVGNEKPKPKRRATESRATQEARRNSLKQAVAMYRAGHRGQRR